MDVFSSFVCYIGTMKRFLSQPSSSSSLETPPDCEQDTSSTNSVDWLKAPHVFAPPFPLPSPAPRRGRPEDFEIICSEPGCPMTRTSRHPSLLLCLGRLGVRRFQNLFASHRQHLWHQAAHPRYRVPLEFHECQSC